MSNTHKVTVGFKCHGELKFNLAKEAQGIGLTLSEYLEMLISQRKSIGTGGDSHLIESLRKKVAFYENSALKDYFQEFKGKTYSVLGANGQRETRQINSMEETFEIILSLAKNAKI